MAALRGAVVGLGMMGRHHVRVMRETGRRRPRRGGRPGRRRRTASPSGVDRPDSDVAELVAAGIDFAVVAAPTGLHEQVALQLAEAGVHVMIEKPLAADAAAARAHRRRLRRARASWAASGHIERFNPALQEARRRLEDGELGEVYQIVTRRQGPFPARIADVGVVKDLATHDIDLTAWVAQSPLRRRSALGSRTAVAARTRTSSPPSARLAERHGHQPPGQLAVPLQGARHRRSPASAASLRRGHPERRPDVLRQRHRADRVGRPCPRSAACPRAT